MARQHMCSDNPDGKDWYEGTAQGCPFHGKQNQGKTQIAFKSIQEKRRRDASGGNHGTQRDGYISGTDYGY